VSAEAERLMWRLLTYADDYGRFPADPDLMLAGCFPRAVSRLTAVQLVSWYAELQAEGIVETWWIDGQFYGRLMSFEKDQGKPRAKSSKYPAPYDGKKVLDLAVMFTSADTCSQMRTSADTCPRSTIYDLRSSDLDLRNSCPDLDSSPRETATSGDTATRQGGTVRSEKAETRKSEAPARAEVESTQGVLLGLIGAVAPAAVLVPPKVPEVPFDPRAVIRQWTESLAGAAKMEPVVGPGEKKRRLRLADRARSRGP
jgi:hypothetical protein